jgi:DNA-binding transcriptional MerR regulator
MVRTSSELSDTTGGGAWSESELAELERLHADGISTHQVVELFADRAVPLSEATFRKYVQLGLLPRSVRVGRKGKHRGSQGLYPATVVRQIELVRRLMAQGYTISEIQQELLVVGSDIDALARQLERVLEAVQRAAAGRGESERGDEVIARAVADARALAAELIGQLRAIERRLAMRARMARAAV